MKNDGSEEFFVTIATITAALAKTLPTSEVASLGDIFTLVGAELTAISNRRVFLEQTKNTTDKPSKNK